MICLVARRAQTKLDTVFAHSASLLTEINKHSIDLEMQSHLAKYLCVLVSGFAELAVRAILAEYSAKMSAPAVASFVEDRLESFYNMKTQRVLELLGLFDGQWQQKLSASIDDELKDALDTVVETRTKLLTVVTRKSRS